MATLKNTTINDTGYLTLPNGTTAQRPVTPSNGMIRVNTSTNALEGYILGSWVTIAAGAVTIDYLIVGGGGGGGGFASEPGAFGGAGGSGVVIIRYRFQ